MLRKLREPVNGLTHLAAALAAAVGLGLLIYLAWPSAAKIASLGVYGITLVLLFSASAAYHIARVGPKALLFLRKLDHAAIYLLIAGTYTPICLHYFTGFWGVGLVATIWALASIGISVKIFVIRAPRWVTAGIYLLMGWLGIAGIREIVSALPTGALIWLLLGGLLFTGGAVIYMLKKPDPWPRVFGFHEIWHIFVILGAASHYVVMAAYVAPAGPT